VGVHVRETWEQTDEGELGFTYAEADRLLYRLVDRRYSEKDLVAEGFEREFVRRVSAMIVAMPVEAWACLRSRATSHPSARRNIPRSRVHGFPCARRPVRLNPGLPRA
jgi:hypothetical protein